uniref:Enolase-phosphatase E1 n=1 Tax=Acrobeloides nanus TaxID=290746 RepID=A0A914BWZ0_9BILA
MKTTLSSQNLFTTTNTTNEYKEVTSTSRSNFKSCIHDKKCDTNNECIKGVCFEGKCRCRCSPFAHCIKNEDCLGRNLCSNKCISENGTSVNCHFKESCALGSQCLQGVCVGIGRYVRDAYEAISCNIENAEIDCQGYGSKSECTIELGVCIRHKNASEIGRNASNECQGGISATYGFPSCISYDDKPIKCGAKGNMQQCSRGSFCGLYKMAQTPSFKVLLLDIEGTTTSISFVKDVLFPYAYDNVEVFLDENFHRDDVKKVIHGLVILSQKEAANDTDIKTPAEDEISQKCREDLVHNVRVWIKKDKKLTALKELQGIMWKDAYESGKVKSHIYPDVLPVLEKVHSVNIPIYIYSSGSVQAQKLLYQYTSFGDVTRLLSGYFDTNIGPKVESSSYTKIASEIGKPAGEILFLTDVDKEAFAAKSAGLQSKILLRDGNAPISEEAKTTFETIDNFEKIL